MPPALALLLCIVFVLSLLRLERKQAPDVSWALWIPTIWMLYSASKPLAIWFGVEGDADGSPLDRRFLLGLFCLGMMLLVQRRNDWGSLIKENTWLFLLIGYMLISILLSDIKFISFKRWFRELIVLIMALVVLSERNPREAMVCVIRRSMYILIPFSVLLIKYFREYGVQYGRWSGEVMWVGVAQQKNGLGRLCMIAAFFFVWSLVRRWQGRDAQAGKYQVPP